MLRIDAQPDLCGVLIGSGREMHDAREHETGVENAEYIIAGEIDGGKFATNYVVLIDIY
jgi:hypothetical protein